MSSIIDGTQYFVRPRQSGSSDGSEVPIVVGKPFSSSFKSESFKIFDDKQNKFTDGPLQSGFSGSQILTSTKTDTIFTTSSIVSGYLDDGYVNLFDTMGDAVEGKISKSVDFMCGPFVDGHLINADIGVKFIGVHGMGLAVVADSNMVPIKKIPVTEFGSPNDVSISADESKMATANQDQSVTLVDIKKFALLSRLHMSTCYTPNGVDFSPLDSNVLVTCSKGFAYDCNEVCIWDTRANNNAASIHVTFCHPALCLRWSKVDSYLISIATDDGFIQIIDTRYPNIEAKTMTIDPQNPILRLKTIDDKLIGFNGTNKIFKIDEILNEKTILYSGLPSESIVSDVVKHKDECFVIGNTSIFPHPVLFNF